MPDDEEEAAGASAAEALPTLAASARRAACCAFAGAIAPDAGATAGAVPAPAPTAGAAVDEDDDDDAATADVAAMVAAAARAAAIASVKSRPMPAAPPGAATGTALTPLADSPDAVAARGVTLAGAGAGAGASHSLGIPWGFFWAETSSFHSSCTKTGAFLARMGVRRSCRAGALGLSSASVFCTIPIAMSSSTPPRNSVRRLETHASMRGLRTREVSTRWEYSSGPEAAMDRRILACLSEKRKSWSAPVPCGDMEGRGGERQRWGEKRKGVSGWGECLDMDVRFPHVLAGAHEQRPVF